MSTLNAAERLLAFQAGKPLPTFGAWPLSRGQSVPRLVLAFVRMAGETGMWGFAAGKPGSTPTIRTIPEPRNQDAAAALACELWDVLSSEMNHPSLAAADGRHQGEWALTVTQAQRLSQISLPGPSHLEMLHHLNFRWARAQKAAPARLAALNALGRTCGFLFRESSRPGQVRVVELTSRLREAWSFPAEGIRQAHLGFLLGLLEDQTTLAARVAAAEREEALSAGATLDPELERDALEPLVHAWDKEPAASSRKVGLGAKIHGVLELELRRRFDLACRAIEAIDSDPRPQNPGVAELIKAGMQPFHREYLLPECRHLEAALAGVRGPFVPDPETDNFPDVAARRFFAQQQAQDASSSSLMHGDPVLAERVVRAGSGVRGTIARVGMNSTGKYPVWTVEVPGQGSLSLRVGARLGVLGLPQRSGTLLEIVAVPGGRQLKVEISNGTRARPVDGAPAANAPALQGRDVVLVGTSAAGISARKLSQMKDLDGPGAWLLGNGTRPATRLSAASGTVLLQRVRTLEKGKKS